MKLDWVVNEDTYGPSGNFTLPNTTIAAAPLTIPRRQILQADALGAPPGPWTGAAFPEGEKQFVKAVRGHVLLTPPTFALGNVVTIGMRIQKFKMDLASGGAILDASYSILNITSFHFANERWPWQEIYRTVDNDIAGFRVKATVNQWLEPDEALYFLIENQSNFTATLVFTPYLRTLMRPTPKGEAGLLAVRGLRMQAQAKGCQALLGTPSLRTGRQRAPRKNPGHPSKAC